jgi:hypothetical protein
MVFFSYDISEILVVIVFVGTLQKGTRELDTCCECKDVTTPPRKQIQLNWGTYFTCLTQKKMYFKFL